MVFDNVGKKQMFDGEFQLYQTANIWNYASVKKPISKLQLIGKKPIIVKLHKKGMWISDHRFIISNGDIFEIIKS